MVEGSRRGLRRGHYRGLRKERGELWGDEGRKGETTKLGETGRDYSSMIAPPWPPVEESRQRRNWHETISSNARETRETGSLP